MTHHPCLLLLFNRRWGLHGLHRGGRGGQSCLIGSNRTVVLLPLFSSGRVKSSQSTGPAFWRGSHRASRPLPFHYRQKMFSVPLITFIKVDRNNTCRIDPQELLSKKPCIHIEITKNRPFLVKFSCRNINITVPPFP